ncbi:hypothetical protein KKG46_00680 [Patescibacteria group bacterium]|nr:hypothetical protein [Patescibacteria group bacterium]
MLLEELYQIVKQGSELPIEFWKDDLNSKKNELIQSLQKLSDKLDDKTNTKKQIDILINTLKQDKINELSLAKNLAFVPNVFTNTADAKIQKLLNDYQIKLKTFLISAQLSNSANESREKLKENLSIEQQIEYDKDLYSKTGMFYCLEYYLTLYKKITDSKTEQEKKFFIETDEVDVGIAKLPGLWLDFYKNEVLEKFIYLILNDSERIKLLKAYFSTKNIFMGIQKSCINNEPCKFIYNPTSLTNANDSLRQLIVSMIQSFQHMGINNLGSQFLTPYGEKPLLSDLIKVI